MTKITTQSAAIAAGFTVPVFATSDMYDFNLLCRPDTDYDDRFLAWDDDTGEMTRVNGSLFIIEEGIHVPADGGNEMENIYRAQDAAHESRYGPRD